VLVIDLLLYHIKSPHHSGTAMKVKSSFGDTKNKSLADKQDVIRGEGPVSESMIIQYIGTPSISTKNNHPMAYVAAG